VTYPEHDTAPVVTDSEMFAVEAFTTLELRLSDVNEPVIVADGAAIALEKVELFVGKTVYVTETDVGLATPTSVMVTRVNPNNVSGTITADTKRIAGLPFTSTLEETTEKGDED
jgi:hypothetical protein